MPFFFVALLPGCAPDKEDDSGKSFTYTITDSMNSFPVGSSIALVHSKATPCGPGGTYSGYTRTTFSIITSSSGPVVLKFSLDYSGAYLESGYIDIGNSGHLSDGDTMLGPSGFGAIYAICYSSTSAVPSSRTLDWTNDLIPLFGGPTTWAGGTQTY